jgi:hypothetical protein
VKRDATPGGAGSRGRCRRKLRGDDPAIHEIQDQYVRCSSWKPSSGSRFNVNYLLGVDISVLFILLNGKSRACDQAGWVVIEKRCVTWRPSDHVGLINGVFAARRRAVLLLRRS